MKSYFNKSLTLIMFAASLTLLLCFFESLFTLNQQFEAAGAANNPMSIVIIGGAITGVLLLSVTDVLGFWLRCRLLEMKVKWRVGIPAKRIISSLYLKFNILILLSVIIGIGAACLCAAMLPSVAPIKIHIRGCVFAAAFCFVVMNAICLLLSKREFNRVVGD